jgi:hypothetical protein
MGCYLNPTATFGVMTNQQLLAPDVDQTMAIHMQSPTAMHNMHTRHEAPVGNTIANPALRSALYCLSHLAVHAQLPL